MKSEVPSAADAELNPHGLMRPGIGSLAFLIVMLSASGLTMARMALVAGLLPTSDFARYATIAASGAFLATIISFGAVEQTIKGFPRLVEEGLGHLMRARCVEIFRLLTTRTVLLSLPFFIVGEATGIGWLSDLAISGVYALVTAGMALVASMQRAMSDSRKLAAGTLLRTAVVFGCVALAATSSGLGLVLATELIATAVVCLFSVWWFVPVARAPLGVSEYADSLDPPATGGVAVFLAFSAINVPFYLDRVYVSAVFGGEVAGRYAVLALFLTAASLVVNTLAQRIGPDAIRLVKREGSARSATRHLVTWIGLCAAFWTVGIAIAAFLFDRPEIPEAIARYAIEPRMLAPIALSGILLNTALLEFLLIALDREKALLQAALGFLAATMVVALAIALSGAGLETLMWAMAASRLLYALLLIAALRLSLSADRRTEDAQQGTHPAGRRSTSR
ncbi:hypothetical protein [Tsuneonella rigui]|uniref:hypothetical protein n=1 Tax=Tsuneonella rigui TaxID=1708790 RepID=UPI000F7F0253|nr:hypothetical protein [Tsuneonella rigui]